MLVLAVLSAAISVGVTGLLRAALYRSGLPSLQVTNYRGVQVPAIGGVVIVTTFLAFQALLALLSGIRPVAIETELAFSPGAVGWTFMSIEHLVVALVTYGFFMLGAIDDLAGAGQAKGLAGHMRALVAGKVTGGAIKAIGGLALGLVCGALWERQLLPAILDALLIASTANIVNLFDLRPGRAIKVFFLLWAPVALAGWRSPFLPVSSVIAASAAAWLPTDLKETGMLGDSGANLLGGIAGVGIVMVASLPVKLSALAVMLALTLVSERHSFTEVIARWSVLRKIDDLGRVRE